MSDLSADDRAEQTAHRRRAWDKQAPAYDRQIGWVERHLFGPNQRGWACGQAEGRVLEVAIGTGLNLPSYPPGVDLTGIELSPQMLQIARRRADEVGVAADLREGDAHDLPFPDDAFDSVVCTYSLCNIPDPRRAIAEMDRVLRPGGRLILVDHVRSESRPMFWLQKAIEVITIRLDGDRMTRRPSDDVRAQGLEISHQERFGRGGMVERVVAAAR
jgi:SAM-dependent methyltransferase